jgi:hypothetical protein
MTRFTALLDGYVQQAEPGSLAGRFAEAPLSAECKPEGQVTHWLFALGDTLAINALRALAVLTSHPIVNTFNHRDREQHEFADRFAPEAWISGDAAGDWSFNRFSHGPQGCPGATLALLAGRAMIATLLRDRGVRLTDPQIDPSRPMPQMLDFFSLQFELPPR